MWQEELKQKKVALAMNIKAIRLKSGLAQEKLALEAGVDRTLVSKIERQIANPTLEILVKLAFTLKVPIITLLSDPKN
jgi:transcriptional regulator with XRE-family HTH domain